VAANNSADQARRATSSHSVPAASDMSDAYSPHSGGADSPSATRHAGSRARKLLWLATPRAQVFRRTVRGLLPKDYLRLRLCGEYASDMSDAAGTLWLERRPARPGRRSCWPPPRSTERAMPRLAEGSEPTGTLRASLADAWECVAT